MSAWPFSPVVLAVALLAVAPAAGQESYLLEIVYELDTSSLGGRSPPAADPAADSQGYVIRGTLASQPARLWRAGGDEVPGAPPAGLWIARRFYQALGEDRSETRLLSAPEALPADIGFPVPGDLAPTITVSLEAFADGVATLEVGGTRHDIAPGETTVLATASREVDRQDLVEGILTAYTAREIDPPAREAVEREVDRLLVGQEGIVFHARVSATGHGPAVMQETDLAVAWTDGQRLAREGPYADALLPLGQVLDALPGHTGAGALYHRVLDLMEAGAVPASAVGRIVFADGDPEDGLRAFWAETGEGYAIFEARGETPLAAPVAVAVADGEFTAWLPAGDYRLSVEVPGYGRAEQDVTIEGEARFDVPVQRTP